MRKTFTIFSLVVFLFAGQNLFAQVSINNDGSSPDASSMLDVKSTSSGILIPRMTAVQRDAIASPATGLMVFVTDDASFHYYNGSAWNSINEDDDWEINGSDLYSGVSGNVGIGTNTPDEKLHVAGSLKLEDGTEGANKILVSDASGVSSWANPTDGLALPDPVDPVPIQYQGSYIYVHPTDNGTAVSWATAQSTCDALVAYGYDDWYLPSLSELNAMYKQSYLITGLEENASYKYWSDTEFDGSNAFTQRLDYGGPDPDDKTETTGHNCRCIRTN